MFNGMYVNDYGEKNNFRMKAYHRMDIGIQFHKAKRWGERIWEISFYNLYNRKNPFYYYTENRFDESTGKVIWFAEAGKPIPHNSIIYLFIQVLK